MIANERQYRITKTEVLRFAHAVAAADEEGSHLHPILQKAMRDGLESQLQELREQLAEYEALRNGQIDRVELDSLAGIPALLIRARIAAGLSQKTLAERLGLKEQQIQRYEASGYGGANLDRIQAVATALGVRIHEEVLLPSPHPIRASDPYAGRRR